ncbi:sialate O-acetylesterase [Hephaestia sp. CMS5P-6]|nr:sialate O-acetylesterase [Hephaestia mangrovi]
MRSLTVRIVSAALLAAASSPAMAQNLLHPMFQDHAVLQRGRPIPVYGDATQGSVVTVSLGGATARATAGADGHWQASLPAMPAGGPYTLTASADGRSEHAQDVMIGDVFLCAGQSNMQFPVESADNAREEIADADHPDLRALTIPMHASPSPLTRFADPVNWQVVSPETVGALSASCYFFVRDLANHTHAPVGMVIAAWGGSRLRAWTGEPALRAADQYGHALDLLDQYRSDAQAAERGWDATWEAWWHGLGIPGGEPWQPSYDASTWKVAPKALGPWALWTGSSPDGFVGQMWLRTEVTLTAAQAKQAATLDLGAVNEEDESWVNGNGVGGTSGARDARHVIPDGVLHAGINTIVTNIFCSWRYCGLNGPPETRAIRFADGSSVPLSQPWRYAEMPAQDIAPQLPWGPAHGVSVIRNGMISPIGGYAFKAALWYQGESDIHYAPHYQAGLTAMMADWRRSFDASLPFVIVQLPDFGPRPTHPTNSAFADIREAQRRAAIADPKADYIVTIDIGDPDSIHPTHKQAVGARLASAVRRLAFGEPTATGPRPAGATRDGNAIEMRFADVADRLLSYSGSPTAFELCGASDASCRFVDAHISSSDTVTIDATQFTGRATRIRYCWGDSPICTVTDGSKLPASPFEVPIRPGG